MTLTHALHAYSQRHFSGDNSWYTWPSGQLPSGIVLRGSSNYHQQVELKRALNAIWRDEPTRRQEIEHYYVVVFGGVRTNSQDTMAEYGATASEELCNRGLAGIATWSKILTARDCTQYAIYDARVAVALNALQLALNVANPVFFPQVTSRNIMIANGQKLLRAACAQWPRLTRSGFYRHYLNTLRICAEQHSKSLDHVGIETFEMLLFSKAEHILDEAFPAHHAALRDGYRRGPRGG